MPLREKETGRPALKKERRREFRERMTGRVTAPRSCRVATTPVMPKVLKIFQNNHKEPTAASKEQGSPGAGLRLLFAVDLNFCALENRTDAGRNPSRPAF